MSEVAGGRPCPACGRFVDSQYCPHCGAKVIFTGPLAVPSDDAPTIPSLPVIPRAEGPAAAVPGMFATEMVPTAAAGAAAATQAWSQAPDPAVGPQTGLFPGWTGMYPAVAMQGAAGALAPRPERRRKAIYAVLGIAAVTVLVLVAALLITPHLGSSGSTAEKDGQPVAISSVGPSPSSSPPDSASSSAPPPTSAQVSVPVVPPPVVSAPVKTTVTVTAAPGSATGPVKTTAPVKTTVAVKTTPKPPPVATPTPKPTPTPAPVVDPLGVPEREITCNAGYVVQLASELDAAAFTAHVARLKASGQLPAGSLAADSSKSCKIFTSQVNTLVLYSGPYANPYDGCAARLAGPADAYIKGSNPGSSKQYISCLCPTPTGALPLYAQVGQQGVWIGEAQRVLGNKLNIDVSDLSGQWGTFTPGTLAAIQQFQQAAHIPPTGALDRRTWRALQSAGC